MFLTLIVAGLSAATSQTRSVSTNTEASLTLRDLSNAEQSLQALRGKIVVLNFWATWCIPCREEMPLLISIQKRYAANGIVVIGASADDESTQPQIPNFIQRLKINFPIWKGATTEHMQQLGLGTALPASAVIDREGRISGRILGPLGKRDLQNRIEYLLGNRQGPPPPSLVDNISAAAAKVHDHGQEGEEKHTHASVGMEGASSVPS